MFTSIAAKTIFWFITQINNTKLFLLYPVFFVKKNIDLKIMNLYEHYLEVNSSKMVRRNCREGALLIIAISRGNL